jgi:DNA-binding response OmpR family regulator
MNFRLLLVEDDRTLRTALCDAFSGEGYEVRAAADGHEARAILRSERFDLCVFDVMLPGPSGLELLRELRQRDADTPALLLTARGSEGDKVLGLELGADDYVTKPFSIGELVARLRAIFRRVERSPRIVEVLKQEEERFAETLQQGLKIFEHAVGELGSKVIPGELAFKLNDTYGFPVDLTADVARERGERIFFHGLRSYCCVTIVYRGQRKETS